MALECGGLLELPGNCWGWLWRCYLSLYLLASKWVLFMFPSLQYALLIWWKCSEASVENFSWNDLPPPALASGWDIFCRWRRNCFVGEWLNTSLLKLPVVLAYITARYHFKGSLCCMMWPCTPKSLKTGASLVSDLSMVWMVLSGFKRHKSGFSYSLRT